MTEFKICGMRSFDHALAAADAGASLLGFVFVPGVRRQVSVDLAKSIIRQLREVRGEASPRIVGLFANQPMREVNRTIRACELDFAQLCGDEPPDYWDNVDAWVVRQVKVDDSLPRRTAISEALRQIDDVVNRLHLTLLDKRVKGALGGTGTLLTGALLLRLRGVIRCSLQVVLPRKMCDRRLIQILGALLLRWCGKRGVIRCWSKIVALQRKKEPCAVL